MDMEDAHTAEEVRLLAEVEAYEEAGREVHQVLEGGRIVGYHVVPVQHQLEEGESVTSSVIEDY